MGIQIIKNAFCDYKCRNNGSEGMIYYSEEIGKNELTETLIQKLIKTAAEQLRFSYTPY